MATEIDEITILTAMIDIGNYGHDYSYNLTGIYDIRNIRVSQIKKLQQKINFYRGKIRNALEFQKYYLDKFEEKIIKQIESDIPVYIHEYDLNFNETILFLYNSILITDILEQHGRY